MGRHVRRKTGRALLLGALPGDLPKKEIIVRNLRNLPLREFRARCSFGAKYSAFFFLLFFVQMLHEAGAGCLLGVSFGTKYSSFLIYTIACIALKAPKKCERVHE